MTAASRQGLVIHEAVLEFEISPNDMPGMGTRARPTSHMASRPKHGEAVGDGINPFFLVNPPKKKDWCGTSSLFWGLGTAGFLNVIIENQ